MEKELESDSEKLDVLQFLFIGRTTGSGKSNSLQILQKMLGLSKSKPILYNNIIPTGRTKKADTITQIQLMTIILRISWLDRSSFTKGTGTQEDDSGFF